MDEYVDPRTFEDDDIIDPCIPMRRSFNIDASTPIRYSQNIDPRTSVRYSQNIDPRTSRSISYVDPRICRSISYVDPRISKNISKVDPRLPRRSISTNNDPLITIRDSVILEEEKPLNKNKKNVKIIKPVNHKTHSCTDVHCLLIFACFIAGWIYVANYAFTYGDLDHVLIPADSKNAKCGLDSGVRNKNKLFYFNLDKCVDPMTPITGCETKQICVESCPQKTFVWPVKKQEQTDLIALKNSLICDDNVDKNKLYQIKDIEKAITEERCSDFYIQSKPFFNRCIWDFSDKVCSVLPEYFSNRNRRSLGISNLINITRSFCTKENQTNAIAKQKSNEANSSFSKILAAIISKYSYAENSVIADRMTIDLKNSYKVILLAFVAHIFAVLIFITLLRWLAAPLVWISIVGVLTGLSFALYFTIDKYRVLSREHHVPKHGTHLLAKFQTEMDNPDVWFVTSIIVGVVLIVVSLILIVIRKRIKIAIAIIKEASKAITNIKSTIFFPIFPGLLYLIVIILATIVTVYLNSIGEFTFKMVRREDNSTNRVSMENCICTGKQPYKLGDKCDPKTFEENCHVGNLSKPCIETSCSFNEIVKSEKTQWFLIFNTFGFIWVIFFISAYEDMVLACTFSIWYWTFNKKDIPKFPLLKAMWITTIYHLGTIAFGSLILSICRMIRCILEFIEKRFKLCDNALARAVLCCMKFFFWLLENFLRFLNRNAYITCAIHSTNFCASSKKSFTLITENILRACAVDRVSVFLFFLSKILVTGCTSWATYLFLIYYPNFIPVYFPFVPVTLVAVISYIMAHVIFSTYSMAVDTLFFCFLEDSTENDGSMEKPFYMSKELNKLLGRKKKSKQSKQIRNDYILNH